MAATKQNEKEALCEAGNAFGWEVLAKVAAGNNGNTFVSPFSISQILALVAGGAAGKTLDAMKHALKVDKFEAEQLAAHFSTLNNNLKHIDAKVLVANSTWTKSSYALTKEFQELANKYGAEAFALPTTVEPINQWCAKNTENRINEIIKTMDRDLVMLLVNALYFKGEFTHKFDVALTREHDFTNADGSKRKVQMMTLEREMIYREDDAMQAIVLDYGQRRKEGAVSCVVMLPRPGHTVDELLQNADNWKFAAARGGGYRGCEGRLQLPRFKAETSLDLSNTLSSMGMTPAFTDGADFSKLCKPSDVHISKVIHKTFLEVNEKGTEAAAVTAVMVNRCAMITPQPPFDMCVDRSFVFALVERASGTILFAGKIGTPEDAAAPTN